MNGIPTRMVGLQGGLTCSTPTATLPTDYMYDRITAASNSRAVYVFGGKPSGFAASDRCWRLDLESNIWSEIANMNEPRSFAAAVTISEEEIIVIGTFLSLYFESNN